MTDKAVFEPAVRAYFGFGNNVRSSKGCITVVIGLGGKIFYDKLCFRENGAWPTKPAPSPSFRANGSRIIPDYKNISEWMSEEKETAIRT
jgi:hypothetical protein